MSCIRIGGRNMLAIINPQLLTVACGSHFSLQFDSEADRKGISHIRNAFLSLSWELIDCFKWLMKSLRQPISCGNSTHTHYINILLPVVSLSVKSICLWFWWILSLGLMLSLHRKKLLTDLTNTAHWTGIFPEKNVIYIYIVIYNRIFILR